MREVQSTIYYDEAANLIKGIEAVGGRLKIYDDRLVFDSHNINIQSGSTEILFTDIVSVKQRKTLGIMPNGILITCHHNVNYKFVVWNRNKIINFISSRVNV